MTAARFMDTNVLVRYFTQDDPFKADRGRDLLQRIEGGYEAATLNTLVVFEVVFLLQKTYRVPRARIREMLATLLAIPNLEVPERTEILEALALFEQQNISFADAYNAVYMRREGLSEVYSWDADFAACPG